ncbi:MAG: hypothetical protein HY023_06195 [Chloroflexi bacterium]|nr:hypothetical protein [Chloroflexota bacterium]
MARQARLITPTGKTIVLPLEIYQQVRQLLAARPRRRSWAKMDKAIRDNYGKLAGGVSLTEALLVERAAERAREDAKLARLHG